MTRNEPPAWVDEFGRVLHAAWRNWVPGDWGPIDFFGVWKLMNGTFTKKLYKAVVLAKEKNLSEELLSKAFPSPSTLRLAIYHLASEYQLSDHSLKKEAREVFDYFVPILERLIPDDTWCERSNKAHSPEEIQRILGTLSWQEGNPQAARELGKIVTSGSALAYALFGDFFPPEANESYGPYDASSEFGNGSTLVIKHFLELRPVELWPRTAGDMYDDIKIYRIFRDVSFSCKLVGMHSFYDGNVIEGLRAYAVFVNNKQIVDERELQNVSDELASKATEYIKIYGTLSQEEIKRKTLEWLCYQFVHFFRLVDIDWRPTKEMLAAVEGVSIKTRTIVPSCPEYQEYVNSPDWEIYWLKELYSEIKPAPGQ